MIEALSVHLLSEGHTCTFYNMFCVYKTNDITSVGVSLIIYSQHMLACVGGHSLLLCYKLLNVGLQQNCQRALIATPCCF